MDQQGVGFVFDVVGKLLPAARVDFLMIGGHAVNHYGYTRATVDVDFMIASDDAATVRSVMKGAGFTNISQSENVVFFDHPGIPVRVDFLQVDHGTMQELMVGAQDVEYGGQVLKVPSLEDLIAMKLFALKSGSPRRQEKDFPDIVNLAFAHNLDIKSELKPLCDKFADAEIFGKLERRIMELRNV